MFIGEKTKIISVDLAGLHTILSSKYCVAIKKSFVALRFYQHLNLKKIENSFKS